MFTAGLVGMLMDYHDHIVEHASNPAHGIPAFVEYPNLARFRQVLDDYNSTIARPGVTALPPPASQPVPDVTPEAKARIIKGFEQLQIKLRGMK